jgi:hypothetical protein
MARTDLSLGFQIRCRAPYRSLCVEVLMQAVRDQRRGHELTDAERQSLRWWRARTLLGTRTAYTGPLRSDS